MADYDSAMDGAAAAGNGYGRDRSPVDSRRERDEEYDRNGGSSGDAGAPAPRDDDYRGSSRRDDRERSPRRRPPPPPPGRGQEAPPSNVLGCFGLSIRTKDIDLEEEFSRYGRVEKATIVYDQRSERSRGFGFVTMASQEDAEKCIEKLNGIELHGRNIRVAYSMTTKPHQSTPGEYMGFKTDAPRPGGRDRFGGPRDRYDDRRDRDRGYGGYRRDDRYDDRRDRGDRGYDRGYSSRRDDRYDDRRDDRYDDRRSSRRDESPRRRSPPPPRDYDRAAPEV